MYAGCGGERQTVCRFSFTSLRSRRRILKNLFTRNHTEELITPKHDVYAEILALEREPNATIE